MQKVLGTIQILSASVLLGTRFLGVGFGGLVFGLPVFCLFFTTGLQAIVIGHHPTSGGASFISVILTTISALVSCVGFSIATLNLEPSYLWTLILDLVIFSTISLTNIYSLVLLCCFWHRHHPGLDDQGEGRETRIHIPPTPSPSVAEELPPSYYSLFAKK